MKKIGQTVAKRIVPTIIVDERILLRQGVASLLHETCYKVIASVPSLSAIRDLRLPPERPLLTVIGLSGGAGKTLRLVQEVHRIIPAGKVVAIGECVGHFDFRPIQNSGIDCIIFDVGSREALLKAFDLAVVGQQLVIMKRPAQSDAPHVGAPTRVAPANGRISGTTESDTDNELRNSSQSFYDLYCSLTEKEYQLLLCLARGESNKSIARSCSIAEATVKAHLESLMQKISAQNRTQAALWAIEHGLPPHQTPARSNGGMLDA